MSEQTRPTLSGRQQWADADYAKAITPHREFGTHKWDVGGVVVIAGSPMYTGAAQLCTRAAGRAGAGIVHLAAPRSVISIIASAIPEVAHIPLPGVDSSNGVRQAIDTLSEHLERARAIVVGPGLGDDDGISDFLSVMFGLRQGVRGIGNSMGFSTVTPIRDEQESDQAPLFALSDSTVVVDADGLNWLAKQPEWWTRIPPQRLILTPHPGELARLLDRDVDDFIADPLSTVEEAEHAGTRRWCSNMDSPPHPMASERSWPKTRRCRWRPLGAETFCQVSLARLRHRGWSRSTLPG